jgi:AcrR family transcriptional regulator
MSAGAADQPRRRGRPRAGADPQGPLAEWLAGLSPTAVHIVESARSVLVGDGFEAVTIERVALEANVDPGTVRRLFVSKAGLLHAVFSRLEVEAYEALVERVRRVSPPEDRLHAYISGLGALIENSASGVGTTEVLAHTLRDPVLRAKIAADYDMTRDETLELAGLQAGGDQERARRLRALASLIIAAIDGLSLQVAADPQAVDQDLAFAMLADMVRSYLSEQSGG